jgi:hypothetical protein
MAEDRARRKGNETVTLSVVEALAKSLNAIESRQRAVTIDDLPWRLEQWRRHLYEAECLLYELSDFGMTVAHIVTSEVVAVGVGIGNQPPQADTMTDPTGGTDHE